ncbi:hypothetical protein GQF42_02585 [Streptomyces broussonetiae]|uniref:Rhamnogalacturonan lyase domain-containing protein n=1 Tax=Streptomyces broussonetiae TaxID=2686304 RepID=A0A6I6N299_9ACTN|nr:hypothetical protein GQF42_02585 [Streptomyces broussonetiae]
MSSHSSSVTRPCCLAHRPTAPAFPLTEGSGVPPAERHHRAQAPVHRVTRGEVLQHFAGGIGAAGQHVLRALLASVRSEDRLAAQLTWSPTANAPPPAAGTSLSRTVGRPWLASAKASGVANGSTALVGLANSTAQYWCTPDASTDTFSSPILKPGTCTQPLSQDELAIAARTVSMTADTTATGQHITSSWDTASARFRIGEWKGKPTSFTYGSLRNSRSPLTHGCATEGRPPTPRAAVPPVTSPPTSGRTSTTRRRWNSPSPPPRSPPAPSASASLPRTPEAAPQITVNDWTSSSHGASSGPMSRVPEARPSAPIAAAATCSLFTYAVAASASIAGIDTMTSLSEPGHELRLCGDVLIPQGPTGGPSAQANSPPTPRNLLVCTSKSRRRRRKVGSCMQSVSPPLCPPPLWVVAYSWARALRRSRNSASDVATHTRKPKQPVRPR